MGDTSSELQKEYQLRFSNSVEYRNSVWKILINDYFGYYIDHKATVLDLGSGWGEFINNISAGKKYAMDLNPEGAKRINEGIAFLQQDCSIEWSIPPASLDVVFTSNFLEHLRTKDALLNTLTQVQRCLKKGGVIICLGPNIKYIREDYWDFYDHYLPLSHVSLCEALRISDFEVTSVIPRFLPYTMADRKQSSLLFVRLYLKLPLLWRVFGKQFLVTAKK
jgi:SAM-dependent methyltransferase